MSKKSKPFLVRLISILFLIFGASILLFIFPMVFIGSNWGNSSHWLLLDWTSLMILVIASLSILIAFGLSGMKLWGLYLFFPMMFLIIVLLAISLYSTLVVNIDSNMIFLNSFIVILIVVISAYILSIRKKFK